MNSRQRQQVGHISSSRCCSSILMFSMGGIKDMQGVIEVGDLLHPETKQPQEEEWFICTAPTRSRFNVLHILRSNNLRTWKPNYTTIRGGLQVCTSTSWNYWPPVTSRGKTCCTTSAYIQYMIASKVPVWRVWLQQWLIIQTYGYIHVKKVNK